MSERIANLWRRLSPRTRSIAAWASLAVVFVALVLVPALRAGLRDVISDSLYLGGVYRDLFIDRVGLRDWNLQPAPSLFPDAPLFFVLRAALGRSDLAIGAYSVVTVTVITLLVSDLARQMGATPWAGRVAAVAAGGAIAVSALYELLFVCAIHPSCHGASLVVGLGVLALAMRQLKSQRPRIGVLLGIALLAGGTAAFDRIFFMYAGAPIAGAVVFCALFALFHVIRCAWVAGALAVGAAVSTLGVRFIRALGATITVLPPPGLRPLDDLDATWQAVGDGAKMIGAWDWSPKTTPWILGAAVVTLLGTAALATDAMRTWTRAGYRAGAFDEQTAVRTFAAIAAWLSMVATLLGTAWVRGFVSKAENRYIQPAFILPCIAIPLFLVLASNARTRVLIAGATVLLALAVHQEMKGVADTDTATRSELWDPWPPLVRCLDAISAKENVHFGYAHYQNARKVTELSRRRLRLLPVTHSGDPEIWIANRYWYNAVVPWSNFLVVTEHLTEPRIESLFGKPKKTTSCPGGQAVWIYDGHPPPPPPMY
jgi:hypothetical protein